VARSYADAHFVSKLLGQLNLTLGALSSRSVLSLLVGALFKNFELILNRGVCPPKCITRSVLNIYLPSNRLELQENETLFKSTLRKYLLTHVFHSVEEFLVHKKIYKLIILLHAI
jgi:hypothetical protein